jgi:hypothetical protein
MVHTMVDGHVKLQRSDFADALRRAVDALGTAHIDVEEFDGAVVIADGDAWLGATFV